MKETSIVRFRAVSKAAKKHGLFITPAKYGEIYITGQHVDSQDPSTHGNLTTAQMLGKQALTTEQAKKFPYIIQPEEQYHFIDGQPFDKNDPTQKALYDFILLNSKNIVASSKASFKRGVHEYYFEDKEAEATIIVKRDDLWYESMTKIRNSTPEKQKQVAILLDYRIRDFHVDPEAISPTRVLELIYGLCKARPEEVLKAFDDESNDDIFILELTRMGVLALRDGKFYDGAKYIGATMDDIKTYMRKEEAIRGRWITEHARRKGKKTVPKVEILEGIKDKICALLYQNKIDEAIALFDTIDSQWRVDPLYNEIDDIIQKHLTGTPSNQLPDLRVELTAMSLEELQQKASTSRRKKDDWKDLDHAGMVDYLMSFQKNK